MKKPDAKNQSSSDGPPAWLVASQWGASLVALTCFFGFGGYFLGEKLGGSFWSIGLMLLGLVGGFSAGLYRIYKASEQLDKQIPNRGKPLEESPKPSESDD